MGREATRSSSTTYSKNNQMTVIYAVIEFYGTEEAEVVGLFSTMKLAEDLKKELPYSVIKEYFLDPLTENPPGQEFWFVKVVSGEVKECYSVGACCGAIPPPRELRISSKGELISTTHCWANDEKQAKSISLNDYFVQTCTITD
jgi:hypothetical protein